MTFYNANILKIGNIFLLSLSKQIMTCNYSNFTAELQYKHKEGMWAVLHG